MTDGIDLEALSEPVVLVVGEQREFPLPSYAGSGNFWSVECLQGLPAAAVTIQVVPPPLSAPASVVPELRLARESVVVQGLRMGAARWMLVLQRSFGPATPVASAVLEIAVTAR